MANSVLVSRESRRSNSIQTRDGQQQQQRRVLTSMKCNRCYKPLVTTVFLCVCDCIFCEECTYSHFNENSNCPVCNRILKEKDFIELVIADPSSASTSQQQSFQNLFTKQSSSTQQQSITFQDICTRVLKHNEELRLGTKFLMKQFLRESSQLTQRAGTINRTLQLLKQENTTLKQTLNTQKMKYEQTISELQKKLTSTEKKIQEKDHQIMQFRNLHDAMTPESPHQHNDVTTGGGGGGGHRNNGGSAGQRQVSSGTTNTQYMQGRHHHHHHHQQQQENVPPLMGFMKQKAANERAKQQALEPKRRAPVLGGGGQQQSRHNHNFRPPSSENSYSMTAPPPTHHQTHSHHNHHHRRPNSHDSSLTTDSPRIRDYNSGFAFTTGRDSKRQRGRSPVHNNYSRNSTTAMSPSQAFGIGTQPGRGPSTYFQQSGYNR